jgi:DNA-binding NarL/FixJ family response regulator
MTLAALTRKQLDVARLVADGHSDKRIASLLSISEGTVGYRVAAIVRRWRLDPTRNIRVQITRAVMTNLGKRLVV